jgi:hypothetical protein
MMMLLGMMILMLLMRCEDDVEDDKAEDHDAEDDDDNDDDDNDADDDGKPLDLGSALF